MIYILISIALIPIGETGNYLIRMPAWLIPTAFLVIPMDNIIHLPSVYIGIIIAIIIYFLIGAFIGWIYGKFKKPREQIQTE